MTRFGRQKRLESFAELLPTSLPVDMVAPDGYAPDFYDGPLLSRPLTKEDLDIVAQQLCELYRQTRESENPDDLGPLPPGIGVLPS